VSDITDRLWEQFQAFCARDLSDIDIEYVYADAIVRREAPSIRVGWKDPPPACRSRSVKLGAA
jgi:hypothetical protein